MKLYYMQATCIEQELFEAGSVTIDATYMYMHWYIYVILQGKVLCDNFYIRKSIPYMYALLSVKKAS